MRNIEPWMAIIAVVLLCVLGCGIYEWHESNQKQECRMGGGEIKLLERDEWSCVGLKQGYVVRP